MNEPRPSPSQHGLPQQHGVSHPQGQPAQRPGIAQPPRVPPIPGAAAPRAVPPVPGAHRPASAENVIGLDDEDAPIALEDEASAPVTQAPPRLPAIGATTPGITGGAAGAISGASASQASAAGIAAPSKIKYYAASDKHTYTKFKRTPHVSGNGACHVRSFHGRLSDDGLAYIDDKINEWLDNHPDVEVKFTNCFVGPLEGKVTGEQGLIVVLWY